MGSPAPRANDLGTIYRKSGSTPFSYTDIAGVSQVGGILTGAYTEQVTVPLGLVDYSHPWVGARGAISMFVDITLSSATPIKMKLQGRYDSSAAWSDIQLVRQDTGAVGAEVTFAASGTYILQTASILAVSQIRVVALGGGGSELDSIIVKGWVE